MMHTYFSTACHHGQHAACREACKFCQEPCICNCHLKRPVTTSREATTIPDVRDEKAHASLDR